MKETLSDAPAGEGLVVTCAGEGAAWLSRLGFIPGEPLTLLTRSPSGVTVRLRGIKYAMSLPLARSVYVRRAGK